MHWYQTEKGKVRLNDLIVMKFHRLTHHELRICPIGFGVKRSRSQCIDYWKLFMSHNCFPFTPIIMKLLTQTPHEFSMCPIDFLDQKVKGQGHNALITENSLCCIIALPLLPGDPPSWNSIAWFLSLYTYHHESAHTDSPWVEGVPFQFMDSKVKVTMHWLLKTVYVT